MPFVHLPVQSGSDRILAAMNRKHTAGDYLGIIDRFRAVRRYCILIGFYRGFSRRERGRFRRDPRAGHTNRIRCAYSFKYSPRPGTPAADMQETVSAAEMDERLVRLQELIDSQQSAFNEAAIGTTVDVRSNAPPAIPPDRRRTAYLQPAHVMASPDIIARSCRSD